MWRSKKSRGAAVPSKTGATSVTGETLGKYVQSRDESILGIPIGIPIPRGMGIARLLSYEWEWEWLYGD